MKFGTSGLRGLVDDMTDQACAAWTNAFLAHLASGGALPAAVLVGRDLRPSSPRIAAACRAALRAAGATAVDCGVLPTPALALEAARRGVPALMVTGSHIPFDRNGLKFYRPEGEIAKADEAGMRAAFEAGAVPKAAAHGAETADDAARLRYRARGRGFFPADALAGLRIGVWQHSAAGRDLMVETLRAFGADVLPLGRANVFTPVDTEAVRPEHAAQARAWVVGLGLDGLIGTDGDGDRPLIADETGAFLRGDRAGLLTARALGADAVATTVSATTAIERSGWVARVRRTRIGSPYVIEGITALAAAGAALPVGFEPNGGFLLGATAWRGAAALDPLPTRDAMLPILALLTEAKRRGVTLSALSAEAPSRATASDRLEAVEADKSGPLLAALAADPSARAAIAAAIGGSDVVAVDLTDGVRMTLATGEIAHLRASGNAPELRVYAEAETEVRAAALVERLAASAAAALRA